MTPRIGRPPRKPAEVHLHCESCTCRFEVGPTPALSTRDRCGQCGRPHWSVQHDNRVVLGVEAGEADGLVTTPRFPTEKEETTHE